MWNPFMQKEVGKRKREKQTWNFLGKRRREEQDWKFLGKRKRRWQDWKILDKRIFPEKEMDKAPNHQAKKATLENLHLWHHWARWKRQAALDSGNNKVQAPHVLGHHGWNQEEAGERQLDQAGSQRPEGALVQDLVRSCQCMLLDKSCMLQALRILFWQKREFSQYFFCFWLPLDKRGSQWLPLDKRGSQWCSLDARAIHAEAPLAKGWSGKTQAQTQLMWGKNFEQDGVGTLGPTSKYVCCLPPSRLPTSKKKETRKRGLNM